MNLSKPRLKPNTIPFKLLDSKSVNTSHDNDYINVEVSKLSVYSIHHNR